MRILKAVAILLTIIFISCNMDKTAQIWTDRPEFALYGEYFNTVQNQYKVSVRFVEFPGAELTSGGRGQKISDYTSTETQGAPDLIVASWLKNSSMGVSYKSLNNLFGSKKLSRNIFYPKLLAMGRIDRTQYLLPVSFNIPALVFSKDRENDLSWFELSNQFTIDFEEIKKLSRPYNRQLRGAFTRMGYSPLWSDEFLLAAANLSGASFREANPLAWDAAALERSMNFINIWTNDINTTTQADDDFTFKYFVEPQERLVQSGRILFTYMESSSLFTLIDDGKSNLDFRWLMEQDKIPITDDSVFIGIPKKAKAEQAAKAFIQWFFKVESQRLLMEYTRANRINENIFAICGGFSALSPVTEQVYPLFYPELLGRMPPSDNFSLPNILPGNWISIKDRVVLPYLHDRARAENAEDVYPLERRLSDWMRLNR